MGCNLVAGSVGWVKVMDFFYAIDADNVCMRRDSNKQIKAAIYGSLYLFITSGFIAGRRPCLHKPLYHPRNQSSASRSHNNYPWADHK